MILKSFVLPLFLFVVGTNGNEYIYDNKAGGWLKLHKLATWDEATVRCDSEGAVLAAPENCQLRDAIKDFVTREGNAWTSLLTGVQANFASGDYESLDGVPLKKMPVYINSEESVDTSSAESCVKWMTGKAEVGIVKCNERYPFVCFKKRKSVVVTGCGNSDPGYKYDDRAGSCYKFHRKGLPWTKAYAMCKKEGGYLAIINNQLENRVLNELFAKTPAHSLAGTASTDYAFVGFRDWRDGESWKTVKGETLEEAGFNVWASGEPNNGHNNEYCGSLYRYGNYNDADCDYSFAFICEKNPDILYK